MVPVLLAGLALACLQAGAPATAPVPAPRSQSSAAPAGAEVSSSEARAPSKDRESGQALLVVGGTILTADAEGGAVEALLAIDGVVRALGREPEVRAAAAGLEPMVLDLAGATAMPGLTDAHVRLGAFGADESVVDLRAARDFDEVCALMAERAAETRPGRWVFGWGVERSLWPDLRTLHHAPLTAAVPDHPVVIETRCGRGLFVNNEALERAGLDGALHQSMRFEDGRLPIDEAGFARGLLLDGASKRVRDILPELTRDQRGTRVLRAQEELLSRGVTCVHDMGTPLELVPVLQDLRERGLLRLRVLSYLSLDRPGSERRLRELEFERDPRGLLELRGLHMTLDGPFEWRGAALGADYSDAKGERGYLLRDPSRITRMLSLAVRNGLQPAFGAEGDRAARMAVDTVESVGFVEQELRDLRPRIEGLQQVSLRDWKRIPELGLVSVMLPALALELDGFAEGALGKERSSSTHVWWMLAPGLGPIAYGSGYPARDPDPLAGLLAARTLLDWPIVARDDVQASVDPVRTALRGFTSAAAYAAGVEDRLGRLALGTACDLTVLDVDPQHASNDELGAGKVLATVVAGEVVWSAAAR